MRPAAWPRRSPSTTSGMWVSGCACTHAAVCICQHPYTRTARVPPVLRTCTVLRQRSIMLVFSLLAPATVVCSVTHSSSLMHTSVLEGAPRPLPSRDSACPLGMYAMLPNLPSPGTCRPAWPWSSCAAAAGPSGPSSSSSRGASSESQCRGRCSGRPSRVRRMCRNGPMMPRDMADRPHALVAPAPPPSPCGKAVAAGPYIREGASKMQGCSLPPWHPYPASMLTACHSCTWADPASLGVGVRLRPAHPARRQPREAAAPQAAPPAPDAAAAPHAGL